MSIRPYQREALEATVEERNAGISAQLLVMPTGCHRKGQRLLMHDGSIKSVEDVSVGDSLMGPDSRPRYVLNLCRGTGRMAEIVPVKGERFVVNEDHLLTLVKICQDPRSPYPCEKGGEIIDISVRNYLSKSKTFRWIHKLFRVPVDFSIQRHLPIEPYFLGVLIGDGSLTHGACVCKPDIEIRTECERQCALWGLNLRIDNSASSPSYFLSASRGSKNPLSDAIRDLGLAVTSKHKFVPMEYKTGSRHQRMEILAGLLDTDGHQHRGPYDFISASQQLCEDVVFIARSLGLAAYWKPCRKSCPGTIGTYYRATISGHTNAIPCRIPRKKAPQRRQIKDVLRTGLSVNMLGVEDYFGFTLTGDGRYLLDDFTVTHNTGKTVVISHLNRHHPLKNGEQMMFLAHRTELINQAVRKLQKYNPFLRVQAHTGNYEADRDCDVIVSSIQTVGRMTAKGHTRRLTKFDPDRVRIVVCDEVHRATAQSYRNVFKYLRVLKDDEDFDNSKLFLGITATPNRSDGVGLECLFQKIVFSKSIREMIEEGWLSRVHGKMIHTEADITGVKTRKDDFVPGELSDALNTPERNSLIVRRYQELGEDMPAIAFTVDVAHSYALAEMFRDHGVTAFPVSGDTPEDKRQVGFQAYREGRCKVLISCEALCLDESTEILTTSGWVGIDGITYSHEIANWDQGRVFFEKPRDIVIRSRKIGEQMVRLEGQRHSVRVTSDHNMVYRTFRRGAYKKDRASNLVGRHVQMPASGISGPLPQARPVQAASISDARRRRLISAAAYTLRDRCGYGKKESVAEATRRHEEHYRLRYAEPEELTEDECRFIGFFWGDGGAYALKSGGTEFKLTQPRKNTFIVQWIDELIKRLGFDVRRRHLKPPSVSISWSLSRGTGFGPQKRSGVYRIEPYLRDANLLWGFTGAQFEAFLHGLWMADGDHQDGSRIPKTWVIHNRDQVLLDTVQAVAVCRGYYSSVRPQTKRKWLMYKLTARRRKTAFSTLRRRLEFETENWKDERVWCVTSTSGNIITRRNGFVTVLGNCEGADFPMASVALMARPTKSQLWYIQALGRVLRPHPAPEDSAVHVGWRKPYALVLDFSDSCGRHSLHTTPSLFGLRHEFDMEGRDVLETVQEVEKIQAEHPKLDLKEAKSVAEIKSTVENIDLLAPPEVPPMVRKHSRFEWHDAGNGGFRLVLADKGIIDICPNAMGYYEVWKSKNGMRIKHAVWRSLPEALKSGDSLVPSKLAATMGVPHEKRAPTEAQCRYLWQLDKELRKLWPTKDGIPGWQGFYEYAAAEYDKGKTTWSRPSLGLMISRHSATIGLRRAGFTVREA